jgi:hypothetical protein
MVCARHHTVVHQGIWTLTMRDGVCWATPPAWADAARTPRRNTTHHHTIIAHTTGEQLRLLLHNTERPWQPPTNRTAAADPHPDDPDPPAAPPG